MVIFRISSLSHVTEIRLLGWPHVKALKQLLRSHGRHLGQKSVDVQGVPKTVTQNHGVITQKVKNLLYIYTGCPRRNVPDFGRVFLMLKYTDVTQNTYVQS